MTFSMFYLINLTQGVLTMKNSNFDEIREVVLFEDPQQFDEYEDSEVLIGSFVSEIYGPATSSVVGFINSSFIYQ